MRAKCPVRRAGRIHARPKQRIAVRRILQCRRSTELNVEERNVNGELSSQSPRSRLGAAVESSKITLDFFSGGDDGGNAWSTTTLHQYGKGGALVSLCEL